MAEVRKGPRIVRRPRRVSEADLAMEIERARRRGHGPSDEPRARSARYDRKSDRVIVELSNRVAFAFPPSLGPGLAGASADQLAAVTVSPTGSGLLWDALDAHLDVAGMFELAMGPRAAMRAMGRTGGLVSSAVKADAARINGAKGGRPRKEQPMPGRV